MGKCICVHTVVNTNLFTPDKLIDGLSTKGTRTVQKCSHTQCFFTV